MAKGAIEAAMLFFEKNNGSLVRKLNMVEVEISEAHMGQSYQDGNLCLIVSVFCR